MESVHTGSWTNWSHGRVQGATLTLSTQNGAYLIAFLALFVRLAGGSFWDIMCYVMFQSRASTRPRDGLHHQQQAILRNHFTDVNSGWQFIRLAWAWRHRSRRVLGRSLPLILPALFHVVAFAAAGIFSSKVAYANPEVLLRPQLCGNWPVPGHADGGSAYSPAQVIEMANWESKINRNRFISSTYANSCYNSTVDPKYAGSVNCNPFGPKRLNWTVSTNSSCPFASELCLGDAVVRFDTGLINSHFDLGVNAPPEDRVEYRHVMECAPLTTDGFATFTSNKSDLQITPNFQTYDNEKFIKLDYGTNWVMNTSYTFVADNDAFSTWIGNSNVATYMIDVEISTLKNGLGGTFTPIDQLNRTDADIFLAFLVNGMEYIEPINDPWFRAQVPNVTPVPESDGSFTNVTLYSSAMPVSVLGCTIQQQWCNPHTQACTPLTGMSVESAAASASTSSRAISLTARQTALLERIYAAIWVSQVINLIIGMDGSVMLAGQYAAGNLGPKLPDDQWIKELNYWFGTMLTGLQLEVLHYVTGDGDPAHDRYVQPATTDDEKWMCTSQMVQRNDFASFSVLGLGLIVVFGGLIVFTNLALVRTVDAFRRTRSPLGHEIEWRSTHWRAAELLQLQRMAYQACGLGTWKSGATADSVPVTAPEEKFGVIPLSGGGDVNLNDLSMTGFDDGRGTASASTSTSPWKSHGRTVVKTASRGSDGLSFQNSIPTPSTTLDVDIPRGKFRAGEAMGLL